jgi:hypothetical protein
MLLSVDDCPRKGTSPAQAGHCILAAMLSGGMFRGGTSPTQARRLDSLLYEYVFDWIAH